MAFTLPGTRLTIFLALSPVILTAVLEGRYSCYTIWGMRFNK